MLWFSARTGPILATGSGTGTGAGAGMDDRSRLLDSPPAPPVGEGEEEDAALEAGGEGPPSISSRSSSIVVWERPRDAGSTEVAGGGRIGAE